MLEQMAGSREPRDRIEAARVLGIMQDPPVEVITALIQDENTDVAAQAMSTAHAVGASSAVAALTTSLVTGLFEAGAPLRHRLISALNKLRQRNPRMQLDVDLIELLLAAEIAGHYRSYQVLTPLDSADGRQAKVIAALRQTMEGELERIFRLIALLAPAASLHDAYVGVRSSNSVVRANALEYLENVLKPGLREVLLPVIDSHVTEPERAALAERIVGPPVESSEQAMAVLLASDDPWLRSRAEIMSNRAAEAPTVEEEFAARPTGIDSDMGAG
jgi:hypothetical protein